MSLNQVIAYVQNALSFVFADRELFPKMKQVYLFGSAVRGELTKQSDVDVFIACEANEEKFVEKRVRASLEKFYISKDFEKWKFLGMTNSISVQAGELKKWDLKTSIFAEGLMLYGRPSPEKYSKKVLFTITLPSNKKTYLKISRELFGRKEKGFTAVGVVQESGGEKISGNAFLLPALQSRRVMDFLHRQKIEYRLYEFLVVE